MTLEDVINSFEGTAEERLPLVRAYTEVQGRMISSDVMTMLLLQNGLYDVYSNSTNPILMATMDRIRTQSEFNFQQGHPKGDTNLMTLELLEQSGDITPKAKADIFAEANREVQPYANTTLEQVAAVTDPASWQEANYIGGNDKVVSTSVNRDIFEFAVTGGIPSLKVRVSYSINQGSDWFVGSEIFTILNTHQTGMWTGYIRRKSIEHMLKGARWVRFETLANDSRVEYLVDVAAV